MFEDPPRRTGRMKFGLWYAAVGPLAFSQPTIAVARAAEAAGFESLWTGDHIVIPDTYESIYPYSDNGRMAAEGPIPMAEPLIWASHLAAATSTIRFGTGVLVVPQREPVLLAKQAATVAALSNDRLILGVGAGWLAEESAAVGADFANRGARLDEYILVMRALWSHGAASFGGEFVSFDGAQLAPRPAGGSIPIVIGGESKAAARRAGRLGDGWFPAKADQESLAELGDLMRASATSAGRDPDAIELTVHDPSLWDAPNPHEIIAEWTRLGVSRVILSPRTLAPDQLADQVTAFGKGIIDHVDHH